MSGCGLTVAKVIREWLECPGVLLKEILKVQEWVAATASLVESRVWGRKGRSHVKLALGVNEMRLT